MPKIQPANSIKSRENNYDLLRIVATVAVIAIHVSASWIDLARTGMQFSESELIFIYAINCMNRFAVPCFVMLSGAFLLADARNRDFRAFYSKIFKRIVIPLIIFSIAYSAPQVVMPLVKGDIHSALSAFASTLAGKPAVHMWYLFMMLIVYFLVPLVIMLKDAIGEKKFDRMAWVFLLLAVASFCTSSHTLAWDIGTGFQYCGYLMIGYTLRRRVDRNKNNFLGAIFIILGLIVGAALTALNYNQEYHNILPSALSVLARVAPLCPMSLISSILVFYGFSKIDIKHTFKSAGHTFMIYLFHAGVWYAVLFPIIKHIGLVQQPLIMLGCIIIVAAISLILSVVYSWVWQRIDSKWDISGKLSRKLFHC